ncbi:something about silencing protein 10 isoform X2 [Jatropha curcas]|uniref:something about silencing protein 10 isoform X2 n=1 Tax=Jatropha curcas TaxID=180498 RepID=UPI0005FC261B|nr:something about silencing protein 10 isoform X2 [Jatropha curcas]
MAKRGRHQTKVDNRNHKRISRGEYVDPQDMDDDIDTFHKQRDIIPLDINDDSEEESIEDEEEPVLDYEDINDDDDDDDDDDGEDAGDDEDGDDDDDDDEDEKGLAAKIRRQRKYIREKFGALDDEIDGDEEEKEENKEIWGGKKGQYYGGREYEMESSDDEAYKEEEEEILRIQRKKAGFFKAEDYGLENVGEDETDKELTLKETSVKGSLIQEVMDNVDTFEELKKKLNSLSREEKMNVVYSSAPELIGLLSELNDALEQLESRVNPLLAKVNMAGVTLKGGKRYLEVQQLLLLAYCQAITFYLLLKSEGQSVRDHPVIARLVEIKGLLDKMKQLDGNLSSQLEEMLNENHEAEAGENKVTENAATASISVSVGKGHNSSLATAEADAQEPAETDQVGVQSMEMLKVRAALEEKLKQKGVFSSIAPKLDKARKHPKSVNGQLETHDDFDDDALHIERGNHGLSNGQTSLLGLSKLSQLVSVKQNKSKVISGDDDLPKRDDIGERRRKHELRVLTSAGVKSEDDAEHEPGTPESYEASDMEEDGDEEVSEDEFYKEIQLKKEAKDAAKAKNYTRTSAVPSLPETVDGKRQITRQIEKNRGLTRPRRKDMKNPRKKYRTKHDKQKKRRQGQVQKIKKPTGSYGGETTGINASISRSVRF